MEVPPQLTSQRVTPSVFTGVTSRSMVNPLVVAVTFFAVIPAPNVTCGLVQAVEVTTATLVVAALLTMAGETEVIGAFGGAAWAYARPGMSRARTNR